MRVMKLPALVLTVSLGTLACGEQATVKLEVDNVTGPVTSQALQGAGYASLLAAGSASAPSVFGMKLIAVYLSEDITAGNRDNVGHTPMIYLNPVCHGDIVHCDLSPGISPDGKPITAIVENFFDLALPSAEVNAALNGQRHSVEPGTYRYLRVEFSKYNAGRANNVRWGTPDTGPVEFLGGPFVLTVPISPALELDDGDSATVALQYDLANTIQIGALASGDSCTGIDEARTCFTVPGFVPSVSR
jgi:hypothetical protein